MEPLTQASTEAWWKVHEACAMSCGEQEAFRVTADPCPFPGHPPVLALEETEKKDEWRKGGKEGRR